MHLISAEQFGTRESLEKFFRNADCLTGKTFKTQKKELVPLNTQSNITETYTSTAAKGKILATLFLEPSTRTRLSFEAAMYKLGGNVITASDPNTSSYVKGESIEDMVCTVANYADVIVLRSPVKGSVMEAARLSPVPVINAGDGAGEHPTQALLDLYTIQNRRSLDGLRIMICGDLLHGRTVHSLVRLLAHYEGVTLLLTSPSRLSLPDELAEWLKEKKVNVLRFRSVTEALTVNPHVIYMTRLQKERMVDYAIHEDRWKDFCITEDQVYKSPTDTILMHPMPRNGEIPHEYGVDANGRSVYLTDQPKNGVLVRMALIYSILHDNVPYTIWR